MAAITLSVPDELKAEMDKLDFVNWSAVARKAFQETLVDARELTIKKQLRKISEISDSDNREVRQLLAGEVVKSIQETAKGLKCGKKAMTPEEFLVYCDKQ